MSCETCRTTIEDVLGGLPGVASVRVDLVRLLVTIAHESILASVDRLRGAVGGQGYEVVASGET